MRKIILILSLMIGVVGINQVKGCHAVTITELNAVENSNGTYTYTFEMCAGIEETYGFYLDFTGPGNLVSYTNNITGPTTGNVLPSSTTLSGVGDLEYGDWDNTSSPPFSNGGSECVTITVTFDDVIDDVTMGVGQEFAGTCAGTTNTTNCFSEQNYTVEVDMPNCNGNVDLYMDGNLWVENIDADGAVHSFKWCGGCATTLTIRALKFVGGAGTCDGGVDGYVVYDSLGSMMVSAGSNYGTAGDIDIGVSCIILKLDTTQHNFNTPKKGGDPKVPKTYYNLLGEVINIRYYSGMYIIVYTDGTTSNLHRKIINN